MAGDYIAIGVRVGADDRTLVVMTYGNDIAFPIESPCWDRYIPRARWSDGAVHLDLVRIMSAEPDRTRRENCDAGAFVHSMTLQLDRPLANAPIVSGTTTLRVFHDSDLLAPTWLPPAWSLVSEVPEQDPQASWYLNYEPTDRPGPDAISADDPERPRIVVATYADDLPGTVLGSGEQVSVRGVLGTLVQETGDRATHQPASVSVTWSEAGRTRRVAVEGTIADPAPKALCLRVAERLASPS